MSNLILSNCSPLVMICKAYSTLRKYETSILVFYVLVSTNMDRIPDCHAKIFYSSFLNLLKMQSIYSR